MNTMKIHVVPHPEGWATRFAGAPTISQIFVSRCDALAWAEGYSEAHGAEIVVHGQDSAADSGSFLRLHFA